MGCRRASGSIINIGIWAQWAAGERPDQSGNSSAVPKIKGDQYRDNACYGVESGLPGLPGARTQEVRVKLSRKKEFRAITTHV